MTRLAITTPIAPTRLSVDPSSPHYRPDAKQWRPVLAGRVVHGIVEVDTEHGWAEGFKQYYDPATGKRWHEGERIFVRGRFELVHVDRIPKNYAAAWLHNMLGALPVVGAARPSTGLDS